MCFQQTLSVKDEGPRSSDSGMEEEEPARDVWSLSPLFSYPRPDSGVRTESMVIIAAKVSLSLVLEFSRTARFYAEYQLTYCQKLL